MRLLAWATFVALPTWLRVASADEWEAVAQQDEDATYYSGLGEQEILEDLPCPDYTHYSTKKHPPYSEGPLQLPFQRPHKRCRKFTSPEVEQVIHDVCSRMKDRDLAHIFQNAFPNTLDTTVLWHVDGETTHAGPPKYIRQQDNGSWKGPHSFIVTGDINAEWLRDSTNQLAQYQSLAASSASIAALIRGAIATQAEFVIQSPYCNAFQPPNPSGLGPSNNGQRDTVHPIYEPHAVFECKYELDSLAAFLSLSNQYHAATGKTDFINNRWFLALRTLHDTLEAQSQPSFDPSTHKYLHNEYTFSRWTNVGTETLPLHGLGNPLANSTGLIRSSFRPSDDATILPFLIPANAMMSVQLNLTASLLHTFAPTLPKESSSITTFASRLQHYADSIRHGILTHGTTTHPIHGEILAYETDGYGSHIVMDDANIPSLLSLPLLNFLPSSSPLYQRTRSAVLSPASNPYAITGPAFSGIGGPHIGLLNAWPMSVLVQAMTSDDPIEILECLERVKNVSIWGLINESVDVRVGPMADGSGMTRGWFAWANSVFAQAILKVAAERPELLFEEGSGRYVVGQGFALD